MHRPTITEIEAGNRRVSAEELSTFASTYDVTVAWLVGDSPEQLQTDDPRLQLAARELSKLKPDDLDRLLRLLASMRNEEGTGGGQANDHTSRRGRRRDLQGARDARHASIHRCAHARGC